MNVNRKSGRILRLNTPEEEAAIQRGIAEDPDNPELTSQEIASMKPASEALPSGIYTALVTLQKRPRGRPVGSVAETTKIKLTMRFDPDVVEAMRATGPGWQTRVNDEMRRVFLKRKHA